MSTEPEDALPFHDWYLEKHAELRLEVDDVNRVEIQLVQGQAEVFGTEMARNIVYSLSPRSKIAIFNWFDVVCKLIIRGTPAVSYLSDQTPMIMYINAHVAIDQIRYRNQKADKIGAKVLVAGATDVGKSTICKLLCNYSTRMNRQLQPCLVDLDVGQGCISIPGSMGILPIERPCDIETGHFNKKASLVFHYGFSSPGGNLKLYNTVTTALAKLFLDRCQANTKCKAGGCIINTCGWVDGLGYQALLHAARAFEVDVVLVLDHERLCNDLQRDLPDTTQIVPLPKSGGVVVRSREFRRASRLGATKEYFYGRGPHPLFPFSFDVSFASIKLFKIGAPAVPESALPIGTKREEGSTQLIPIDPSRDLIHLVLSLSMATSLEEDLVNAPVAGFLLVTAVDMEAETMTVLSPAQRPLPRKYLLLTDIKYMDLV